MSFLDRFRIPYADDKVAGLLFLVTFLTPLYIVVPLPDPVELPKLILWLLGVGFTLILIFWKQQATQTVLSKTALISIGLLFAWSIFTTFFSEDVVNSLFGVNIRLTNSVLFFLLWGLWLFLVSTLSRQKFEWLLRTIVISGGIIATWGIMQSFEIGFYNGMDPGVRATAPSFLGNPNFTAMFLVPVFMLSIWAIHTAQSFKLKIFYGAIAGFVGWGVILFTSRGAILGLAAALLVALVGLLIAKQKKLFLIFIGLFIVIISLSTIFTKAVRPIDSQQLTTLSDQTTEQRLLLWDITTDYILAHPLVGTGPANFFLAYRTNNHPAVPQTGWFDDGHNLTLHLATVMGMPAVIFLFMLIGSALWVGYKHLRNNPQDYILPIVLMSGLVGWFVAASFNPVTSANWLIFGLLIVGLYQVRGVNINLKWKSWFSWIMIGVGILIILIGILWQLSDVLVWRSNTYYVKGEYAPAEKMVNWAYRINPFNLNAIESKLRIYSAQGDYKNLEITANYYQNLHPKSAGVLQKAMSTYYLIFRHSGDEIALQKFYVLAEAYKQSYQNSSSTHENLTYAFLAIGDYQRAVQSAETNVVMNNQSAYHWFLLAKAYEKVGDREGVVYALDKAFHLHPTKAMSLLLTQVKNPETPLDQIAVPLITPENPW